MELCWVWMSASTLLACYVFVDKFVRRLNGNNTLLPPGDMGWPLIGNLIPCMIALSSGRVDSFINNFVSKYGATGIYKTHLFGKPSIMVCTPEMCKRVLTDDESFKMGYPNSVAKLFGSKAITDTRTTEQKRLRHTITSLVGGHNVIATYIERIEEIVINSLEDLSSMKHPVELFREMENVSFKVITHVFLGSHIPSVTAKIKDLFKEMSNCNPIFSLDINFPGFAFFKSLKVREKLVKVILIAIHERRLMIKDRQIGDKKDLVDILMEGKGENGEKLGDKDTADTLLGLMFAGHETTAIAMMWSLMYLTQHPDVFRKAKFL
ncbi:Beta-amyrin 11-oxidase, partial [Mucuna pruriens]